MPSYCKDHIWLSLLQAISHSEKTYMNTEKAFLHFKTACDAISPDFTGPGQDSVKILNRHFRTQGTLSFDPSLRPFT